MTQGMVGSTKIYRLSFETVSSIGPGSKFYNGDKPNCHPADVPYEYWHETITDTADPWDQYHTLKQWAESGEQLVRNVKLLEARTDWQEVIEPQAPSNPPVGSDGKRIVYGANCLWWDSIDKAAINRSDLPCCPHCGSVLFEVDGLEQFLHGVDAYEADGHPGYRQLLMWRRGKCFKTLEEAAAAMVKEATL